MSALHSGLVAFCIRVKAGENKVLNSTGHQVECGRWEVAPVRCWWLSSLQSGPNAEVALKQFFSQPHRCKTASLLLDLPLACHAAMTEVLQVLPKITLLGTRAGFPDEASVMWEVTPLWPYILNSTNIPAYELQLLVGSQTKKEHLKSHVCTYIVRLPTEVTAGSLQTKRYKEADSSVI